MCEEIGADYILINASLKTGIADIRTDIMGFATSISLIGGRKVVILDEADRLSAQAQDGLKGIIEEVADNCSFVFTCNYINKIIDPIHSRCAVIDFKLVGNDKAEMASQFYKRVQNILFQENEINPFIWKTKAVADLILKHFPDYRRILNELQHHSKTGSIDESILFDMGDAQINELIKHMKKKDFRAIRQWVGLNGDNSQDVFRAIYDKMFDIVDQKSVPVLVVLLGKYQDMASNVIDQEINLCAFIVEVLIECDVK